MLKRDKKGVTRLDHLKSLPSRAAPTELNYPDRPPETDYLVEHYNHLKKCADPRITYADIKAYKDVTGLNLSAYDAKVIMRMEDLYMEHAHG